jgi:hypothetical protein
MSNNFVAIVCFVGAAGAFGSAIVARRVGKKDASGLHLVVGLLVLAIGIAKLWH